MTTQPPSVTMTSIECPPSTPFIAVIVLLALICAGLLVGLVVVIVLRCHSRSGNSKISQELPVRHLHPVAIDDVDMGQSNASEEESRFSYSS